MNPFKTIFWFKLHPFERLGLILLFFDCQSATRIDLNKDKESPASLRMRLMRLGFQYVAIDIPGDTSTVSRFAIAKTQSLAEKLKIAVEKGDTETIDLLTHKQKEVPLSEEYAEMIGTIKNGCFLLYDEMLANNFIAA